MAPLQREEKACCGTISWARSCRTIAIRPGPTYHCADRAMGRLRMFVELALEKFRVPARDFLDRNSVPIT